MDIYFASGNENKRQELQQLLPNHRIILPKDLGQEFCPKENKNTFYENSLKKAKTLFCMLKSKSPVIADDSGLCVKALHNAPGVFSSRYGGQKDIKGKKLKQILPSAVRNRLLLEHIDTVLGQFDYRGEQKQDLRSAFFVCAATLYINDNVFFVSQSCIQGKIVDSTQQAKGENGFGYDPIFYIPELKKTMAQLTPQEKNTISHRAKAFLSLKQFIDSL